MEKGLKYRIILVVSLVAVGILALMPTLFYDYNQATSKLPGWWMKSRILPTNNLNLGLDLRGGIDLLIGVDVAEAELKEIHNWRETLRDTYQEENINYQKLEVPRGQIKLVAEFSDRESMDRAAEYHRRHLFQRLSLEVQREQLTHIYQLREAEATEIRRRTVTQIKNIISRRIDDFGLREPTVAVQGDSRIRLQLPGAKDPEDVKSLVVSTARLDFMIVEHVGELLEEGETAPSGSVVVTWTHPTDRRKRLDCYFPIESGLEPGSLPHHLRLVKGKEEVRGERLDACFLLSEEGVVSGKDLVDARPRFTSEQIGGGASVSFTLNRRGASRFARLTGENVGRRLAIVLEDFVESAPVVRSRIFDRGEISGDFTPDEATVLATVLRSGALDVQIEIEEERVVGASLGADAIRQGERAIFWGFLLVVIFMVAYYSLGGLIADLALLLNIVFILAVLSLFNATLTLPGIAGIVLTVGMAVDANVLIFERVREEMRTGKTPHASIEAGYAKALWTILDANITTLVAALVLLQWGTGPIRGFAITLAVGIFASLFTAIVVTRVVYDLMFHYRKGHRISIGIKLEPAPSVGRK